MSQSTIPAPAGSYEEYACAVGTDVRTARAATVTQALALKLRREQATLTEAVRALSGERAPEEREPDGWARGVDARLSSEEKSEG
jgi:hypothetical protein